MTAGAGIGPVRHILLARLREGTSAEQLQTVMAAFREMAGKVEGITSFEHGANNSPEGLNRGLTYAVVLTFANSAARDAYLPHPEHRQFGEWVGQFNMIEEVLVFDYTPQG